MWVRNPNTGQWLQQTDTISENNFSSWKQDMSKYRLYSKCLSGATYVPITGFSNIYDILSEYIPRTWYVGITYSTPIPYIPSAATKVAITGTSSVDYYSHFLSEDGITLKNLFTPTRLINDSLLNYNVVDVATTTNLVGVLGKTSLNLKIDGITLLEGHRVLVKDQISNTTLPNTTDPNTYFTSNYYIQSSTGLNITYYYYNSDNGVYKYTNGKLIRESDLNLYENCIRYSTLVKLGTDNRQKQFHLSRLLTGYFPTTLESQPIEFIEKHNYVLRNQVDYNNLFEIVYNDCIKHATQSVYSNGITYSIPTRTIAVGEFGIITNYQEDIANIINNKYKVILKSITQTSDYYWICGDYGTLLKVSKIDFSITRIDLNIPTRLNSVSFFNDSRGVVVGLYNIIFYTDDGGYNWNQISTVDFSAYNYNRAIYYAIDKIYIGGDTGVFLELTYNHGQWISYKRRISKFNNINDEYILVENINDMKVVFYSMTQSLISLVTNNSNMITFDPTREFTFVNSEFDFNYIQLDRNYGDILSTSQANEILYFSSDKLYNIDISTYLPNGYTFSNISTSTYSVVPISNIYPNRIFDFSESIGEHENLVVCGNNSLFDIYGYTPSYSDIVLETQPDINYDNRLKSKLLFMDYDIGSKLNFFDDTQVYRLPNSVSFTASYLDNSYLEFYPLTQSNNSGLTESNWISYWKDRSKTFQYHTHMEDQYVVKPSFTFSSSDIANGTFSYTYGQVSTSLSDIIWMAPNIINPTHSRYIDDLQTIFLNPAYNIYAYDYLMIWSLTSSNSVGAPQVGDMVHILSDDINAVLMINRISTTQSFGITTYHQYIYTDFN